MCCHLPVQQFHYRVILPEYLHHKFNRLIAVGKLEKLLWRQQSFDAQVRQRKTLDRFDEGHPCHSADGVIGQQRRMQPHLWRVVVQTGPALDSLLQYYFERPKAMKIFQFCSDGLGRVSILRQSRRL